ncbi:MAG: glycoside hydrolase family 75 protein [Kofleriaceae bacterium]
MRVVALVVVAACSGGGDDLAPDAAGPTGDAPPGLPTATELLARIANCDVVGGPYASDDDGPVDVSICGFPGAVAWQADLDVDCDGKTTPQCNLDTDPAYQDQTAATDSMGDPLDAAALPYVVIPGISPRFDYRAAGLGMKSIVAVVYEDRVVYGPLGDVGPQAIIGEASYAMAEALGIDPDPSTGGVEGGVAYIAFTGDDAKLDVIEDHDAATTLGVDRARRLLASP